MKITKAILKEMIREEIQNLEESPMGRAQMFAKGLSKDTLALLKLLKKEGDPGKIQYFMKDIKDAIQQIEKNLSKS